MAFFSDWRSRVPIQRKPNVFATAPDARSASVMQTPVTVRRGAIQGEMIMAVLIYDGSEYTMDDALIADLKAGIETCASSGQAKWFDMPRDNGEVHSILIGPGIPMTIRPDVVEGYTSE